MTTEGPIGLSDDTFINGVLSTANPKPGKGNIHTNDASSDSIIPELTSPTDVQRLSVTGQATSVGAIKASIDGNSKSSAEFVNPVKVNRDELLGTEPYTIINQLPADGIIRGHQRIPSVDYEGSLFIEEGAVLHVSGDFAVAHSVGGSGTLVVDGDTLIRGSNQIDLNNPRGVLVYSGGGVAVVHPEATRQTLSIEDFAPPTDPNATPRPSESRETFHHVTDPVASFLAARPTDTEYNLRQGLPLDAPTDLEFFEDDLEAGIVSLRSLQALEGWRQYGGVSGPAPGRQEVVGQECPRAGRQESPGADEEPALMRKLCWLLPVIFTFGCRGYRVVRHTGWSTRALMSLPTPTRCPT